MPRRVWEQRQARQRILGGHSAPATDSSQSNRKLIKTSFQIRTHKQAELLHMA